MYGDMPSRRDPLCGPLWKLGRADGGEVVQIETMTTGRVLSRVQWTPENGGKYIRVEE